jgi:hypothetical protein
MRNKPKLPLNEQISKTWRSLFGFPYVYFSVKTHPKSSIIEVEFDYNSAFLNKAIESGYDYTGNDEPDDVVKRAIIATALQVDEDDDEDDYYEDTEEDDTDQDNYVHKR